MSQPTSFFLDLLRLGAAFAVFAYHCVLIWYPAYAGGFVGDMGHRSVIVFFVLSGYVIAFSTLGKPRPARNYVSARLSRLYSVALPALILTAALQLLGTWLNPAFYAHLDRGHTFLRYLMTTFFCQSLWTLNVSPPTNGPFWSLGYEFWYYAIFGAAVLIRSPRARILTVAILVVVSGIDSLLLMPAWLMGVALYLYGRKISIPPALALPAFVVMFGLVIAAIFHLPDYPKHYGYPPFVFSSAFVSDDAIALLLTLCIWFFDQAFSRGHISDRLDAVVRWSADHTFSLYLYHYPMVLFVAAVIPFDRGSFLQLSVVSGGILIAVLLLSLITQPTRMFWRDFFELGCTKASAVKKLFRTATV